MTELYGRIMIDYASFWILGNVGVNMAEIGVVHTPIAAIDDFVYVRARVNGHYAAVRAVTHEAAPPVEDLNEWDEVAEVSAVFTAPPYLFVPLTERDYRVDPQLRDLNLEAGHYRIRCYTTGGATFSEQSPYGPPVPSPDDQDADPASYVQQFRLDFWPDPQQLPSGTRTLLKISEE